MYNIFFKKTYSCCQHPACHDNNTNNDTNTNSAQMPCLGIDPETEGRTIVGLGRVSLLDEGVSSFTVSTVVIVVVAAAGTVAPAVACVGGGGGVKVNWRENVPIEKQRVEN